jgi:hypothetical protein
MANAKKHYWKIDGAGVSFNLPDGSKVFFEKVYGNIGFAIVDDDQNEQLVAMLGTGGLVQTTKGDYDELKKKPPLDQSPRQWREEFSPEMLSSSPQYEKVAAAVAADAEQGSDKDVTPSAKQAKQAKLPADDKPLAGKRKAKTKD